LSTASDLTAWGRNKAEKLERMDDYTKVLGLTFYFRNCATAKRTTQTLREIYTTLAMIGAMRLLEIADRSENDAAPD
jgi:hypothetical protein